MIRNAKDLSPDQKAVIESLRREQAEDLRKYFSEVDPRRTPGTGEDAEEILTEAISNSRPGYRPHQ
jgi:hypothetical protein